MHAPYEIQGSQQITTILSSSSLLTIHHMQTSHEPVFTIKQGSCRPLLWTKEFSFWIERAWSLRVSWTFHFQEWGWLPKVSKLLRHLARMWPLCHGSGWSSGNWWKLKKEETEQVGQWGSCRLGREESSLRRGEEQKWRRGLLRILEETMGSYAWNQAILVGTVVHTWDFHISTPFCYVSHKNLRLSLMIKCRH